MRSTPNTRIDEDVLQQKETLVVGRVAIAFVSRWLERLRRLFGRAGDGRDRSSR